MQSYLKPTRTVAMNKTTPEPPAAIVEQAPAEGAALSPLRERFCRYYLTEPSATRAAVKAGYSERTAPQQASRLLSSVNILQRIDAIRRSENLVYQLSPQAVMDRCEAIFEEALEKGRFEAAIAAMRLQAKVGGLLKPDAPPATKPDLMGVVEHCVRTAVSRYVAFGTVGALNPLTPPPWPAGDEAARRTRRKMKNELDPDPPPVQPPGPRNAADAALAAQEITGDPQTPEEEARNDAIWRARHGWPRREGDLAWPGNEASLYRAAVAHDDDHYRAMGVAPATPRLPASAPPEAQAERERAYRLGRTPEPGKPERVFPPGDDDEPAAS